MENSTKTAIGVGAATYLGGVVGQGVGVVRTGRKMNAQIDADCAFLDQYGYLPEVEPYLPLTGAQQRSKVAMFLVCWALGSVGIFALIFFGSTVLTAAANDPEHSVAAAMVGGGFVGLGAGVLFGWVPGALLFAILGMRENSRRAVGVVLEEFKDYWDSRTEAMHAIPQGRDPEVVRNRLALHRLPLDDDE